MIETSTRFRCFGGEAAISVLSDRPARAAVEAQKARLLSLHDRFTGFDAESELSRFNADPREVVPASPELRAFAHAAAVAADLTAGLVDAAVRPGARSPQPRIRVDDATVRRPAGTVLDSGGIAKGLFADWVADSLAGHAAVAVDCGGDLRITGVPRVVSVPSPFNGFELLAFEAAEAGVATSGTTRRGAHVLDPATGLPVESAFVQVTAVAPTALEAELRAKAALVSADTAWLARGGVVVRADGSTEVLGLTSVGRDRAGRGAARDEVQRVEALAQLAGLRVT